MRMLSLWAKQTACCCQAVARGYSRQGGGMKVAGVERCDDSDEMR